MSSGDAIAVFYISVCSVSLVRWAGMFIVCSYVMELSAAVTCEARELSREFGPSLKVYSCGSLATRVLFGGNLVVVVITCVHAAQRLSVVLLCGMSAPVVPPFVVDVHKVTRMVLLEVREKHGV